MIDTVNRGLVNKRTSQYDPNYSIIKISQNNNNKSPGDLRRLTVIQTPEENLQPLLL